MKNTSIPLTTLTILTALMLATSGCAKKAEQTASMDSNSDLEVLAGLAEGAGSAQNSVEIIPVPAQQAGQGAIDISQQSLQQGLQQAGQLAATVTAAPKGTIEYAKQIQTALKNAGLFSGTIDGKIGPKTKEAIKAFQTQNGLKADGVAGAQTWAKLAQYYAGAAGTSAVSTIAE
jgi:murein L,D-transpeptidase YcbB/YkuD